MKKYILAMFLASLLLLAACSGDKTAANADNAPAGNPSDSMPPPPSFEIENPQEDAAAAATGDVKEFTITASKWQFEPSKIVVKKGDRVKLHITSTDVKHGFGISEYDINEDLPVGQTADVQFIADKSGSFMFYCSVFCGAGHGSMRGELVVE